jgi:P27 family predicted phage terminase small subunit
MPKAQINGDEPVPEDGVPECPSNEPKVREVWDYTVRQLRAMRVLTMADRDSLHVYCQAVVMHNTAAEQLSEQGMFLNTPKGPMRNSATMVMKEAAQVIRQMAHSFGMTPQARSAIKVGDQSGQKDEPKSAARLLSG